MPTSPAVVQPGEGDSYWQPVPANGFVELKVSQQSGAVQFDCGIQSVATDSFVREHAHADNQELILVYQGMGKALVEGEEHLMQPGTVLHLNPHRRHQFINTGEGDLRFFWILMPGGLGDFFATIGRPRDPAEPAPKPFPRPDDIAQIEASTVFASPQKS